MGKDIELSPEIKAALADLEVQAMMFNMEIDYEAGCLTNKKNPVIKEFWLVRYLDKLNESDHLVIDNGF
jgi:hypothetical protein